MFGSPTSEAFYKMITVDQFGMFFKLLILAAVILVILASNNTY